MLSFNIMLNMPGYYSTHPLVSFLIAHAMNALFNIMLNIPGYYSTHPDSPIGKFADSSLLTSSQSMNAVINIMLNTTHIQTLL
jgi:uncharacterized NAD-dependent epimerase/dehydratase family protein